METKNVWSKYSAAELKKLETLSAEYIDFLNNGKNELECVDTIVIMIEDAGYL